MLATSREPLAVPGEVTWRVPSLDAPPAEPALAVATVSQYDAVRLSSTGPGGLGRRSRSPTPTPPRWRRSAIVSTASRWLSSWPLPGCRQFSVERIARDLDDRFRVLTGGARTLLPRHQTLAASIDWSHDRLEPAEAVVFRRLGVFAGLFPLEAAEAVVAGPGDLDPVGVFDTVSRLADKNLVVVEDTSMASPATGCSKPCAPTPPTEPRRPANSPDLQRTPRPLVVVMAGTTLDDSPHRHRCRRRRSFYDCLNAALDWSLDEPAIGLAMLRYLSRPLTSTARVTDILVAVDRLLTDENKQAHPHEWLAAVNAVGPLLWVTSGPEVCSRLGEAAEAVAISIGDDYATAIARHLRR